MYNKSTLMKLKKELEETLDTLGKRKGFNYEEFVRFINGKIQDPREPWEVPRDSCS